jgi:hypothetical protein
MMARRRRNPSLPVGIALVAIVAIAEANSSGPLSGSAQTGCGNGCHGTTPAPAITLDAPAETNDLGTVLPIRVTVVDDLAGGGGFMLEASAGKLVPTSDGVRNSAPGEVTHDGLRLDLREWSAEWRSDGPVVGCAIDLWLAAMATNANLREIGDHWGRASSQIALVPTGDTTDPTVPTFVSPKAGTIVNSGRPVSGVPPLPATVVLGSVKFELQASDETAIRDVVLYDADALGAEVALGPAAFDRKTGRWTRVWSTKNVTPGPHRIRAVATDCAGNASEATVDLVAF